MSVFETVPDEVLADVVDWVIGGDEGDGDLLLSEILPAPSETLLEAEPWLRSAWEAGGMTRVAVLLWDAKLDGWHDADLARYPERGELGAFEDWARRYAVLLRFTLIEPATAEQIGGALATLVEVVDQGVPERMATFIIELIERARLPLYVVHAICERVAAEEAKRIRPASFTGLLGVAQRRLRLACQRSDAVAFVRELEPALAYLGARMVEEPAVASSSVRW